MSSNDGIEIPISVKAVKDLNATIQKVSDSIEEAVSVSKKLNKNIEQTEGLFERISILVNSSLVSNLKDALKVTIDIVKFLGKFDFSSTGKSIDSVVLKLKVIKAVTSSWDSQLTVIISLLKKVSTSLVFIGNIRAKIFDNEYIKITLGLVQKIRQLAGYEEVVENNSEPLIKRIADTTNSIVLLTQNLSNIGSFISGIDFTSVSKTIDSVVLKLRIIKALTGAWDSQLGAMILILKKTSSTLSFIGNVKAKIFDNEHIKTALMLFEKIKKYLPGQKEEVKPEPVNSSDMLENIATTAKTVMSLGEKFQSVKEGANGFFSAITAGLAGAINTLLILKSNVIEGILSTLRSVGDGVNSVFDKTIEKYRVLDQSQKVFSSVIEGFGASTNKNIGSVKQWTEGIERLSKSLRITQSSLNSAAGEVVASTASWGLNRKQMEKLVEISGHYAKISGEDIVKVARDVVGALNGQTQGVQRLGLKLADNDFKTAQLTESYRKMFSELTNGEKRALRLNAVMNQYNDVKNLSNSVSETSIEIINRYNSALDIFLANIGTFNDAWAQRYYKAVTFIVESVPKALSSGVGFVADYFRFLYNVIVAIIPTCITLSSVVGAVSLALIAVRKVLPYLEMGYKNILPSIDAFIVKSRLLTTTLMGFSSSTKKYIAPLEVLFEKVSNKISSLGTHLKNISGMKIDNQIAKSFEYLNNGLRSNLISFKKAGAESVSYAKTIWPEIKLAGLAAMRGLGDTLKIGAGFLLGNIKGLVAAVRVASASLWASIAPILISITPYVAAIGLIVTAWYALYRAIKWIDETTGAFSDLLTILKAWWNEKGIFSSLADIFKGMWGSILLTTQKIAGRVVGLIADYFAIIPRKIIQLRDLLLKALPTSVVDKIISPKLYSSMDTFVGKMDKLNSTLKEYSYDIIATGKAYQQTKDIFEDEIKINIEQIAELAEQLKDVGKSELQKLNETYKGRNDLLREGLKQGLIQHDYFTSLKKKVDLDYYTNLENLRKADTDAFKKQQEDLLKTRVSLSILDKQKGTEDAVRRIAELENVVGKEKALEIATIEAIQNKKYVATTKDLVFTKQAMATTNQTILSFEDAKLKKSLETINATKAKEQELHTAVINLHFMRNLDDMAKKDIRLANLIDLVGKEKVIELETAKTIATGKKEEVLRQNEAFLSSEAYTADEKLAIIATSGAKEKEMATTVAEGKKQLLDAGFSAAKQIFSKNARMSKAISIAEIIKNTAVGVMEVWAKFASIPPIATALSALVGATGAAQAGQVASTQDQFATGGIVGGSSYYGDKVPIKVNSGEMILNKTQQKSLFDFLKSGGKYADFGKDVPRGTKDSLVQARKANIYANQQSFFASSLQERMKWGDLLSEKDLEIYKTFRGLETQREFIDNYDKYKEEAALKTAETYQKAKPITSDQFALTLYKLGMMKGISPVYENRLDVGALLGKIDSYIKPMYSTDENGNSFPTGKYGISAGPMGYNLNANSPQEAQTEFYRKILAINQSIEEHHESVLAEQGLVAKNTRLIGTGFFKDIADRNELAQKFGSTPIGRKATEDKLNDDVKKLEEKSTPAITKALADMKAIKEYLVPETLTQNLVDFKDGKRAFLKANDVTSITDKINEEREKLDKILKDPLTSYSGYSEALEKKKNLDAEYEKATGHFKVMPINIGNKIIEKARSELYAKDIKNIAKFSEGGIVGGNLTTGDRIPIRVNSGEMILNKDQQAVMKDWTPYFERLIELLSGNQNIKTEVKLNQKAFADIMLSVNRNNLRTA